MKSVNLKSLIEIYELNNGKFPQAYINFLGSKDYQLTVKQKELCPLISLLKILSGEPHSLHTNLFNYFYVGYEIPQIGKEFDLLRINNCSVLNIEYKREFSEKITNQLKRNQYYLKFLNKEMYLYTYVEKDNTLYTLNSKKELIQTTLDNLANVIKLQCEQGNFFENNLNELFDPCNYLISPFRKTPEFLNNEYFLTKEQEEIEHNIKKNLSANYKYFVITGDAGSGKTLLTYHLAKDFKNKNQKIGLIHCGNLNDGHLELKQEYNWEIEPIKYWKKLFENSIPEIIIIDEFQRINKKQFFEMLNNYIKPNEIILILSGDGKQTLSKNEGEIFKLFNDIDSKNVKKYKLKAKIRTNKELDQFIKIMLDLNNKINYKVSNKNINITYFNNINEANRYIASKEYNYISYTPSQYYENKYADSAKVNPKKIGNAHAVIGQEFENVIVILGEQFYYDDKILKARKMDRIPYSTAKMFFQQITRAINKLEIVVVNNLDVFNKLIEIFD